jgi:hypothetical protein
MTSNVFSYMFPWYIMNVIRVNSTISTPNYIITLKHEKTNIGDSFCGSY